MVRVTHILSSLEPSRMWKNQVHTISFSSGSCIQFQILKNYSCPKAILFQNFHKNECWIILESSKCFKKSKTMNIIIIILSCHQQGYPWPFLAISPYRSSLSAGPQIYNPYPHRAAVCRFKLVALLLLGHVKGSIGVHHLWAHPYISSSVLHVWFVWLG